MIAIFETNIDCPRMARMIIKSLLWQREHLKVTLALDDEDKILRVEGPLFEKEEIIAYLNYIGFRCTYLPIE